MRNIRLLSEVGVLRHPRIHVGSSNVIFGAPGLSIFVLQLGSGFFVSSDVKRLVHPASATEKHKALE